VDSVPDTLLRRKFDSAGNGTRELWVSRQELYPVLSETRPRMFEVLVFLFLFKVIAFKQIQYLFCS
jgi:hypothetical protein